MREFGGMFTPNPSLIGLGDRSITLDYTNVGLFMHQDFITKCRFLIAFLVGCLPPYLSRCRPSMNVLIFYGKSSRLLAAHDHQGQGSGLRESQQILPHCHDSLILTYHLTTLFGKNSSISSR